jgi:hypothetical protein
MSFKMKDYLSYLFFYLNLINILILKIFIEVNGGMEKGKVKESCIFMMEEFIRVILKMIRFKVKNILIYLKKKKKH